MGFFQYCEKVSCRCGLETTMKFIHLIYKCYISDKNIGECADIVMESRKEWIDSLNLIMARQENM